MVKQSTDAFILHPFPLDQLKLSNVSNVGYSQYCNLNYSNKETKSIQNYLYLIIKYIRLNFFLVSIILACLVANIFKLNEFFNLHSNSKSIRKHSFMGCHKKYLEVSTLLNYTNV